MNKILIKNIISLFNLFFLLNKKKYNKKKIKKILYISIGNSGIGDILMQFPSIYLLNKKFKNSQIDFLFPVYTKFLFQNYNNNQNNFYFKDKSFKKIIKELRKNNYDLIISNHWLSSFLSNLISFNALKIGFFTDFGFKDNYGSKIESNFKIDKFKGITDDRIGKFLLMLYSFNTISKEELFLYRNDYSLIKNFTNSIFNTVITATSNKVVKNKINIVFYFKHNNHINKFGLSKYFLDKIYNKLNHNKLNFIIIGPSYDSKTINIIKKKNIIIAKDISWSETISILKNSDLIICDDSSILHFSLLLLKDIIGVFNFPILPIYRIPNNRFSDVIYINNFFSDFSSNTTYFKNIKFIQYEDYLIELIVNKVKEKIPNIYK